MAQRTPLEQTFSIAPLNVTNQAGPVSNLDLNSLTDSFIICNFSANANSIWWGDQSVSTVNGIEITPGSAPMFIVEETRQLYEVQNSLIRLYEKLACEPFPQPDFIPVVCWNPSHIFVVTNVAGPVPCSVAFFKNVYV